MSARRRTIASVLLATAFLALTSAHARILRVGAGADFGTIAAAAQEAWDGDTIEIPAGEYPGDVATWRANNLTIRGVGGRPHISANGNHVDGKGSWLVKGNDVVIENVELSGAKVPDGNGAGIRVEGRNLTLRNCYLHHNEMNLLAGITDPLSTIRIEHSEIAHSGGGAALGHGIYVGRIAELVVTGSYLHHAQVGHQVKSRAATTSLRYNKIADGVDGKSSYLVDAPSGGRLVLVGNVLQKSAHAENRHFVRYGEEGLKHDHNEILAANNTFASAVPAGAVFVGQRGATQVVLRNNLFYGRGGFAGEVGELRYNLHIDDKSLIERIRPGLPVPGVEQPDFRLAPGSPAIDAGVDTTSIDGIDLVPRFEYVHPVGKRPRPIKGRLDVGAFELE